jgi:hypothetical protein
MNFWIEPFDLHADCIFSSEVRFVDSASSLSIPEMRCALMYNQCKEMSWQYNSEFDNFSDRKISSSSLRMPLSSLRHDMRLICQFPICLFLSSVWICYQHQDDDYFPKFSNKEICDDQCSIHVNMIMMRRTLDLFIKLYLRLLKHRPKLMKLLLLSHKNDHDHNNSNSNSNHNNNNSSSGVGGGHLLFTGSYPSKRKLLLDSYDVSNTNMDGENSCHHASNICCICYGAADTTTDANVDHPDENAGPLKSALKICPKSACGKSYHNDCISSWLRSVPSSRRSFGAIFGNCPYCGEWISAKFQ